MPIPCQGKWLAKSTLRAGISIVNLYDLDLIIRLNRTISCGQIEPKPAALNVPLHGHRESMLASWEVLAREIWPQNDDRAQLRRKWDVNVARLRRNLQRFAPRECPLRLSLDEYGAFLLA